MDDTMPPPPPPDAAKSVQKLSAPKNTADTEKDAKFSPGMLIWAKMTGHPFWPCMVTADPIKEIYTTLNARGQRQYHCQFFGTEAERGWVNESATLEYQGRDNFLSFVESQVQGAATKGQRKQAVVKYEIRAGRRQAWDISALAADQALSISDTSERLRLYTFHYRDLPHSQTAAPPAAATPAPTSPPTLMSAPSKPNPITKRKKASAKEPVVKKPKVSTVGAPPKEPNYTVVKNQTGKSRGVSKSVIAVKDAAVSSQICSLDDPFAFDEPDVPVSPRLHISPLKMPKPSVAQVRKARSTSTSSTASESSAKTKERSGEVTPPIKPKVTNKVGDSAPLPTTFEIFRLTANSTMKKETVCSVCERGASDPKLGELITCTGSCLSSFHTTCTTVILKDTFKCNSCVTGLHACFMCKEKSGVVQKCSQRDCGKYYHMACIAKHPLALLEDGRIECPLHACASCIRGENGKAKARIGKQYKCIRCPTAYHTGDFCIGAGSKVIAGYNMICCNHLVKDKKGSHHTHINVNWCFNCSQGGTLVCCETCPAAFHMECLTANEKPCSEGAWYCTDCRHDVHPRYGDIVWVKLGGFRWWPSEVCHPEHVPLNIQQKSHEVGEFAVHFLGSNDYNWMHRGRVFPYQEGDKGSKESNTKNLNKKYKLALEQASEGYTQLALIRKNKDQIIAKICDSKPRRYKYLKTNLPIPPVKMNRVDKEEIPVCECNPAMDSPCGENHICLNRMLYYECHPASCPCGDKCQNQRFQRRRYPKQEPFRTGDERGWGLKAKTDIKRGEFVNEYVGELITEEECKRRIQKYHEENLTTFYMLTLDSNRVIDAGPKGNLARFANHSCDPNMKTQKWYVNGNWRVGLFALKDIPSGAELTFNYNLVSVGEKKLKCLCKAPSCSGFIGERSVKPVNEKVGKRKKVKKRHPRLKHDDWCFRCLDGGELLMCNRNKCHRAYHLACLGLEKVPYGKWDCPWHHCDDCGKSASILCSECPNSFCNEHHSRNIQQIQGFWFCRSHTANDISTILAKRETDMKSQIHSAPSTPGSSSTDASVEGNTFVNPLVSSNSQLSKAPTLIR
ncbi:histone-lysine N-methyltransferase NSD2-like isoform X2 [Watersipora subatra]|uniref:histone-lysine N-methyltransferase NSD2-like isoform X2 n=1 Tax=Watersipora subatra TaxID=2589382 RepID=UPI00355AF0E3